MLSYIALPVLAMAAQIFYYGFSLINLSICIAMILMFVVSMVEQNRNLACKEKEAADLRISLMFSQIAPHFIYNTLTTIQELCEKDPKLAKETVGEFSTYLRGNLTSLSETGLIPFAKELEHIQCYCTIEKKRFGDRVHVEYEIAVKEVIPFEKPEAVLQYVEENRPEIAFISAENADGRGYFLIKKIRQLSPQTNIIAVAREYRFAQEMMKLRVSGYVTGKFTLKKVIDELQNLRFQCEERSQA